MGEYHLSPSDSENGRFSDLLPRLFGVVLKLTPLLRRTSNFFISYGVRITTYACIRPSTEETKTFLRIYDFQQKMNKKYPIQFLLPAGEVHKRVVSVCVTVSVCPKEIMRARRD